MGRILIVDEQPVTRQALRQIVESEGLEVIAEADNGMDALQQARQHRPDLMILELSIPRLGGLEVLQRMAVQQSPVRVLVLTSQDSEYFAGRCLSAGASGFVSKHQDGEVVREALRAILQGHSFFPAHALGSVNSTEAGGAEDLHRGLSVREVTVLQMLARGLSNIAIAEQLSLSDKTVSTYKVRLMQKLHAKSLVELIDIGRRHGVLAGGAGEGTAGGPQGLDDEQLSELERLRKMIEAMPDPMTIRTLDTRILYSNRAFQEMVGLKADSLIGLRMTDIPGLLDEEEAPVIQRLHSEAIGRGEPYEIDLLLRLKSGPRFIHHWGRPYYGSNGQLIGAICGSMDVTERDRLLADLRNAHQRAEAANRSKVQFLTSMGNELSSLLQSIVSMVDLSLAQDDPAQRREPLHVARAAASNLLGMLDDLQQLNRLESKAIHLAPEVTDLRALVEQQLGVVRESAWAKGLALETDFSMCQSSRVWVDPLRMRQILRNLLDNAVRYTDQGFVRVVLSARAGGTGMVEVKLEVEDSGIGVAADDHARIFEPFSQALDANRVRRGGTGLGLALCKGLVDLMGGGISLQSQVGVGTRVAVMLVLTSAQA